MDSVSAKGVLHSHIKLRQEERAVTTQQVQEKMQKIRENYQSTWATMCSAERGITNNNYNILHSTNLMHIKAYNLDQYLLRYLNLFISVKKRIIRTNCVSKMMKKMAERSLMKNVKTLPEPSPTPWLLPTLHSHLQVPPPQTTQPTLDACSCLTNHTPLLHPDTFPYSLDP